MLDHLTGEALVAALVLTPWLLVLLPALAAGFAAGVWWQHRRRGGLRDQHAAVAGLARRVAELDAEPARLRGELVDARLLARLDRAGAAAAQHRAANAHARAAALAGDVVALQHQLAQARQQITLALLEATTEWEVDPR